MADDDKQSRLARLRAAGGGVIPITLPEPDGGIDTDDRRHLLGQITPGVVADPDTEWAAVADDSSIWTAVGVASSSWTPIPTDSEVVAAGQDERLALLRASGGGILPSPLPAPDGDVDAADRRHLAGLVSPGFVSGGSGTIWTEVERHEP